MISERPEHDGRWYAVESEVQAHMSGDRPLPEHLPTLLCKGLCHDSCGPAPMTPVEFGRVEKAIGRPLVVHSDTLLICRAWGMSEGMMCPHGCVTTNGLYLTYAEVMGLSARQIAVEGDMIVPDLD